jgi:hypothetical protein
MLNSTLNKYVIFPYMIFPCVIFRGADQTRDERAKQRCAH